MSREWQFACPQCRSALQARPPLALYCPTDDLEFPCEAGVWRLLTPEREAYYAQFIREYETVREAEGRGSTGSDYYRNLPDCPPDHPLATDWRIRALSFGTLMQDVVVPAEERLARPMSVLDVGAGNGWLAYRLAKRGHTAAAVDLMTGAGDGLGASKHYDASFTPVQAEFDRLPFCPGTVDLVIYNAAFHYSLCYETSVEEALRVLRPGGVLVIVDSPVYRDAASGLQMVRERRQRYQRRYGFRSDALPSEEFLTYERLAALQQTVGARWHWHWPVPRWRQAARTWRSRLAGRREPAQFPLLEARRP